jgi:DNA-directed RNA polymerase subunit RPC12/RpoP
MYFVRKFQSGGESYDVRQKTIAVYVCSECRFEYWSPILNPNTFKETDEIRCPKCNCLNATDKKQTLLHKKEILIHKKSELEKEIDKICKEIESAGISV